MASFLARASKVCAGPSARSAQSVSLLRSSILSSCAATHLLTNSRIRYSSVVATAKRHAATDSEETDDKEALPAFSTLEGVVSKEVLKAITGRPMNLTTMSPVQAEVFPLLPELARPYNPQEPSSGPPRDILVKAKTGTGKTLGFLVPAVEARLKSIEAHGAQALRDAGQEVDAHLEHRAKKVFARSTVGTLVISPTRELATQITKEALRLTSHLDDFGVRLFVGGENKRMQMREWMNSRRDIVVATPGRLRDMLESEPEVKRGISKTQVLVLDEADTLLDMGFRPDIEAIKKELPPVPERQTFLFSATVSRAIQDIAESTLAPNHKFINCVSSDASPVHAHVPQYHTVLPSAKEQLPHVLRLLAQDQLLNPSHAKAIVFLPTTKMTQLFATILRELARSSLPARNTKIYELHSKKSMESRTRASSHFRNDTTGASVLVTSDVSARGVDYPGVTRVIQVGIPGSTEQYIHRVGRTGRGSSSEGRGDLVLLPCEMGFVRTSLSMVPLKPLTASDLISQVETISQQFDDDPASLVPENLEYAQKGLQDPKRLTRWMTQSFQSSVKKTIDAIDSNVEDLTTKLDEEAVKETFMSLLGYYLGRIASMRTSRDEIVQGLKDWTTTGLGLAQPPYVSEALLARFGVDRPRRSTFERSGSRGGFGARGGGYGRADYGGRDTFGSRGSYGSRGDSEGSYGVRGASERGSTGGRGDSQRSFGGRGDSQRSFGRSGDSQRSFGRSGDSQRSFGGRGDSERGIYGRGEQGQRSSPPSWMGRGQQRSGGASEGGGYRGRESFQRKDNSSPRPSGDPW